MSKSEDVETQIVLLEREIEYLDSKVKFCRNNDMLYDMEGYEYLLGEAKRKLNELKEEE